jgi:hypothetical protein
MPTASTTSVEAALERLIFMEIASSSMPIPATVASNPITLSGSLGSSEQLKKENMNV